MTASTRIVKKVIGEQLGRPWYEILLGKLGWRRFMRTPITPSSITRVSFELFMSMLSALKFVREFMEIAPTTFAKAGAATRRALKQHLRDAVTLIRWGEKNWAAILNFVRRINCQHDVVITCNYDLLIEAAIEKAGVGATTKVLHLHVQLLTVH
jgi:hypothetical protein